MRLALLLLLVAGLASAAPRPRVERLRTRVVLVAGKRGQEARVKGAFLAVWSKVEARCALPPGAMEFSLSVDVDPAGKAFSVTAERSDGDAGALRAMLVPCATEILAREKLPATRYPYRITQSLRVR